MKNQKAKLIRWLLWDKYQWPDQKIRQFLDASDKLPTISEQLQHDLERLETDEPIAYIIGWVPFYGCRIDLRYQPLIPRPETEYWVERWVQSRLEHQTQQKIRILDLCCGSGCIGISILKHLPSTQADFIDISKDAIDETLFNLRLNEITADRYQVCYSDLFEKLDPQNKYDAILCNPPYVDPQKKFPSSLKYEPAAALFADDAGLAVIEKILAVAPKFLAKDGELVMEFGAGQDAEIKKIARRNGFAKMRFELDQYGVCRWCCLELSQKWSEAI